MSKPNPNNLENRIRLGLTKRLIEKLANSLDGFHDYNQALNFILMIIWDDLSTAHNIKPCDQWFAIDHYKNQYFGD